MGLDEDIAAMGELLGRRETVKKGDYVLTRHVNLFYEFLGYALDAAKLLYEEYKSRVGEDARIELLLRIAESRLSFAEERKWGDVVLPRDHNVIVDVGKALEVALALMEEGLS